MLINFFLAILLIALTVLIMVTLDTTTSIVAKLIKQTLKWTRRSKLLTKFVLQAYIHYRKMIHKPLINNSN